MTIAAFALSVVGFMRVPQQFFPASDRLEVVVDMRLPEGSSFAATAAEVAKLEAVLNQDDGIASYVVYTGSGSPRFFLASSPELTNANYAQFVVNTKSVTAREGLLAELTALTDRGMFPDVRLRVSRLELGPPVGYPVQFRIVGPDPSELRQIAGAVEAAMRTNPHVRNISDNWGNPSKMVDVQVDQDKARLLGLSSEEIATTLQTLQQGSTITRVPRGYRPDPGRRSRRRARAAGPRRTCGRGHHRRGRARRAARTGRAHPLRAGGADAVAAQPHADADRYGATSPMPRRRRL